MASRQDLLGWREKSGESGMSVCMVGWSHTQFGKPAMHVFPPRLEPEALAPIPASFMTPPLLKWLGNDPINPLSSFNELRSYFVPTFNVRCSLVHHRDIDCRTFGKLMFLAIKLGEFLKVLITLRCPFRRPNQLYLDRVLVGDEVHHNASDGLDYEAIFLRNGVTSKQSCRSDRSPTFTVLNTAPLGLNVHLRAGDNIEYALILVSDTHSD